MIIIHKHLKISLCIFSAFGPALNMLTFPRLCITVSWRESRCDKLFSVEKKKQGKGKKSRKDKDNTKKCVKVQQIFPPSCCVLKENIKVLCPGACYFMLAVIWSDTNAEQLVWKLKKKKVYCLIGYGNLTS